MHGIFRKMFILLSLVSTMVHAESATVTLSSVSAVKPLDNEPHILDRLESATHRHAFEIQQHSSQLKFHVDSPIGDVWVSFNNFRGSFSVGDSPGAANLAEIEVNAGHMETDRGLVGVLLRGESFLDVDNYPSMRFVGHSFEWYGERYAILKGDMTIKDTTRQVAFYVELLENNDGDYLSERLMIKATTTIKRSEFGIHTLIPFVSDNVNLFIEIEATPTEGFLSIAEK